eukprot:TRINITY_DN60435_c0_g1_i1.p1 TRINITY_DN60435_c0_g1~~TRINITY_DN60435_c0_g1_i1.p1  ORF type:complete len:180 (+),score=32.75 TRINITY_DN60435_c0_g1_i1:88-627(+)
MANPIELVFPAVQMGVLTGVSRLRLKEVLTYFGEVEHIHKPPSSGSNGGQETASVRFARQEDADKAVAALKAGKVIISGVVVNGDFRSSEHAAKFVPTSKMKMNEKIEDSRSLAMKARRRSGSPRRRLREKSSSSRSRPRRRRSRSRRRSPSVVRRRSRSRSRSRRRSRSRSRSRSRKR